VEIIGEKLNATRAEVAEAIATRDVGRAQDLARRQVESGAAYLDVNAAGVQKSKEPEDLVWLVESVQAAVEVPLCLDSANPEALTAALGVVQHTPLVNSISGEAERLDPILPLVAEHDCSVIALAADETGIGKTVEQRMGVVRRLVQATRAAGVPDAHVLVDPLVLPLAGLATSGAVTLDTMRAIRDEFPDVRLCLALSNLSFGLPERALINRVFLTLALAAGLDAALMDPTNAQMMQEYVAAEMVLGRDPFCRQYTQAYRGGRFGFPGKGASVAAG
jgi:5-methyltetrahydrofolate corrinoid/iron sulfur protein methyltransferase